jgi:acid phosphatase (class A)
MTVFFRLVFATTLAASLGVAGAFAQTPVSAPADTPSESPAPAAPAIMPVAKTKTAPAPDPHWLSPEEIKAIAATVPPPPAPGSPADQADLQTEIDVQNNRTLERSQQAKQDASLALALFLTDVNPALNAKNDPMLYLFFQQVGHEASAVNGASKARFGRPRPFIAHADVIHPLGTIGGSSYPSGHATVAFCDAVILGQIFPDKADLFLDDAKRIAQSRVVMGVHYTTDIQEGERDGRETARVLLTKPDFLARLTEVKAEAQP